MGASERLYHSQGRECGLGGLPGKRSRDAFPVTLYLRTHHGEQLRPQLYGTAQDQPKYRVCRPKRWHQAARTAQSGQILFGAPMFNASRPAKIAKMRASQPIRRRSRPA